MKNLLKLNALLALFLAAAFISNASEPLKNATITLKSPDGKTYTATTDASGKFQLSDVDEDCDGFSIQVKSGKSVFMTGSNNKVSVQDISMTKVRESPTKSSLRESPTLSSTGSTKRDAASGQATGKRQHKPFTFKTTLCPKGTGDCDDTDACVIELTSDGEIIQGMAINQKGTPGSSVKYDLKQNK